MGLRGTKRGADREGNEGGKVEKRGAEVGRTVGKHVKRLGSM